MTVKFMYASGESASKLRKLLLEHNSRTEINEQTIGSTPHLVFSIPEKPERKRIVEINEPNAVRLALSSEAKHIFQLNRLETSTPNEGLTREYKVMVLNLSPLRVWRRDKSSSQDGSDKWAAIKTEGEDKEIKRIITAARIAVQALGLDFALAHVGFSKLRKPIVFSVDPSPALTPKTRKALVKFLVDSPYSPKNKEIKLGADPEFILINQDTGKMIPASRFLPRYGNVGCDSIRIPNRQQRPIGELRPEPSESPLVLAENIRKTLLQAVKLLPYSNIQWVAGSQPTSNYPIGGHIHFSNITYSSKLLRALDNYLAIPVFLMENSRTSTQRRTKYGLLSDFRIKDYGFEYRTISSWLVAPEITKGVLCLAKLIAYNYTLLDKNYFTRIDVQKAFYNGDKSHLRNIYQEIWGAVTALPGAKEYASYLEPIHELCHNSKDWDESRDIRETWGIPIPKKKYRAENKSKKSSSTRVNVRIR
ncbi:MAG: putative amidoligase domain-containing protein [Syntrophomonadales bacterium]